MQEFLDGYLASPRSLLADCRDGVSYSLQRFRFRVSQINGEDNTPWYNRRCIGADGEHADGEAYGVRAIPYRVLQRAHDVYGRDKRIAPGKPRRCPGMIFFPIDLHSKGALALHSGNYPDGLFFKLQNRALLDVGLEKGRRLCSEGALGQAWFS